MKNVLFSTDNITHALYIEHDTYEVTNKLGDNVGINILLLYYGNLWESAMRRLEHKMDGYIFTIQHMGNSFKVYRKTKPDKGNNRNQLQIAK